LKVGIINIMDECSSWLIFAGKPGSFCELL
jgi:hypothetical protein